MYGALEARQFVEYEGGVMTTANTRHASREYGLRGNKNQWHAQMFQDLLIAHLMDIKEKWQSRYS